MKNFCNYMVARRVAPKGGFCGAAPKGVYRAVARIMVAVTAILAMWGPQAAAQTFTWDVDFRSVFDNREGDGNYTPAETILFTNLAPEIGVEFGHGDKLAGGVVWNQPIGREWEGARVSPTLYYRHDAKRWAVAMGMLPRTQLREELPNFLWCDSLRYHQHNIRGVLLQYNSHDAFVDFYLDWRQLQTTTQREAFNVVFHGQWHPGARRFFVGGHAMMNHYALTKNSPADMHIVDNFLVNPYVGVDLSHATALDSLQVRAGALVTVERNRAYDNWTTPAGGWLELVGEWRWLGLKNTLYAGGRLLPSYSEFRGQLYPGEPFYSSTFYNRTDLYAHVVRNRRVELDAALKFNFANNCFLFYQCITLRVHLSGSPRLK